MSRINQLLQFLQDNPKDSFIQYALALEYIKIGEPNTGRQYFEQLISNDPDYVGTYYHLAKLYVQLNEKALAENCYENGIAIAKKLNDAHSLAELQNAYTNLKMGISDDD